MKTLEQLENECYEAMIAACKPKKYAGKNRGMYMSSWGSVHSKSCYPVIWRMGGKLTPVEELLKRLPKTSRRRLFHTWYKWWSVEDKRLADLSLFRASIGEM